MYKVSNTTTTVSSSPVPSNVKVTSTVPSVVSGVNVVSAVTSLPSTKIGSFVARFISLPDTVYSLPTSRSV